MLRNAFTLVAGGVLLVLGLVFSAVLIAVVAVLGLAAWGYLRWKTRKLRRTMAEPPPEGQVIEGEAVVVEESRYSTKDIPRGDPPGH